MPRAISNTATITIAPVIADGALVYWSTASFASMAGEFADLRQTRDHPCLDPDATVGYPIGNAIADAARAYRVYYQKVPSKDGGPYLMDHSSIVYLLDRNGRFVTHFTHEAKAEAIAASVGKLL